MEAPVCSYLRRMSTHSRRPSRRSPTTLTCEREWVSTVYAGSRKTSASNATSTASRDFTGRRSHRELALVALDRSRDDGTLSVRRADLAVPQLAQGDAALRSRRVLHRGRHRLALRSGQECDHGRLLVRRAAHC